MRTAFGSLWMRLWRGGVRLAPIEVSILRAVRDSMPDHMRSTFDRQLDGMNLVQRSLFPNRETGRAAWRGLHFYRIRGGRADRSDLPKLPIQPGEVKLLRLELSVEAEARTLHVTAHAMDGCFFDIQCGEDWRPFEGQCSVRIRHVHQSWRSNVAGAGER